MSDDASEWFQLDNVIAVDGYQVNMIATMTNTGSGRAVLLHLRDQVDGTISTFVMDPDFAGQSGWDMVGIATGWLDAAYGDRLLPPDPSVQEAIRRVLEGDE
jgi:hypothetical protein